MTHQYIKNFLTSQFVTNINLSESFQKPESKQNPEKAHTWSFKRLSRTCNFFNGNQWIVLESKQFVTQATQNTVRIWNFLCLMLWNYLFHILGQHVPTLHFDTQLRHVHQLAQINYFHQALFLAYRLRDVSLKYMLSILFSFGTRIAYASLLEQLESWYAYSHYNLSKTSQRKNSTCNILINWKKRISKSTTLTRIEP